MVTKPTIKAIFTTVCQGVTSFLCSLSRGGLMILELSQKRYFARCIKVDLDQGLQDNVCKLLGKVNCCAKNKQIVIFYNFFNVISGM